MSHPNRHVGILVDTSDTWGRNIVESACRFAQDQGWTLLISPRDAQGRLRVPRVWKGHGLIAALRGRGSVEHVRRLGLPVVDVSRAMKKEDWFARVTTNDHVRAELAVGHLVSRGIQHFACYAPAIGRYSDHRSVEFVASVEAQGLTCATYQHHGTGDAWLTNYAAVSKWLAGLPRPLGVLAGDPYPARQLIEICSVQSIRVPDDVAIISGDDDELLCNVAMPRISSIELASHQIGVKAVSLLDRMMRGKSVSMQTYEIPPLGIRARESTDIVAIDSPEIAAAVRFIRDNACEGIGVADVAKASHVSRRTLEYRFQELLRCAPAEHIRRVRFERVRRLLVDTKMSIETIAFNCGFASGASLAQSYKKYYHETPGYTRRSASSRR